MRKIISITALCCALSLLFTVSSCNSPAKDENKKEIAPAVDTVHVKKDSIRAQAYVCPMGSQCGQGPKAGKCPNCGMEMKPDPEFK